MEKNNEVKHNPEQATKERKPFKNSETRQWRVGTFSMGFTLIALGLFLILGRLYEIDILTYMMTLWPLLIIVLGLEMIAYNFLTHVKKSGGRFTYDFISIFLVILFLLFSMGVCFLESSGLFAVTQRYLLSSAHIVEEEKVSCPVNDGIQSLIMEAESKAFTLRSYEGDKIKVSAVYKGYFASREEAEVFAMEQPVKQERLGDTLYLKIFSPAFTRYIFSHQMPEQEITVYVPEKINVELRSSGESLDLYLPAVKSNWEINFHGRSSNIYLDTAENARLGVEISRQGSLQGNVSWDQLKSSEEEDLEAETPQIKAFKNWGDGEYTIFLRQTSGTAYINVNNPE